MSQSKYLVYEKFRKFLKRKNVEKSGAVATLLLEMFVGGGRQMKAEFIYDLGLCQKHGGKNFSQWRADLVRKNIIIHERDSSYYHPGTAIISYINEQKTMTHEVASMNDLQQLEKRMLDAIDKINKNNPPATSEKVKKHLKIV